MNKPHPYRPTKGTVALLIVLGFTPYALSWRAVQTADDSLQDARRQAEAAKVEVAGLRCQLDRQADYGYRATIALLENASAQDDLLLGAYRGQDITARVQALIEAQQTIEETKTARAETDRPCR